MPTLMTGRWIQVIQSARPSGLNGFLNQQVRQSGINSYPGAVDRIFILGGFTGKSSVTEAQVGAEYLIQKGVDEKKIHREESSRHTFENLVCVRDLLARSGTDVPVIISNRYHLARCKAFADELGMPHVLCAAETEFVPDWGLAWKITVEAYYLHWFEVARLWSSLTGARFHRHTSKKSPD